MITTNPVDMVIGGLTSALSVLRAHKDTNSVLIVLLALGRVKPFMAELDQEDLLEVERAEALTTAFRFLHQDELDYVLTSEIEFRLYELETMWMLPRSANERLEALIQVDEIIMACRCARRNDLVRGAMPELERIFAVNSVDQAEISDELGKLLKNHPRDGAWGELLGRIAQAKESVALAKAVLGR